MDKLQIFYLPTRPESWDKARADSKVYLPPNAVTIGQGKARTMNRVNGALAGLALATAIVAALMPALGHGAEVNPNLSPVCYTLGHANHSAEVSGDLVASAKLSQAEAYRLVIKREWPLFKLDSAMVYQWDMGQTVMFFRDGCMVAFVDLN